MPLTPKDEHLAAQLKKCGVLMPLACLQASKKTGLELALAASLLQQETGGGRNEWGHDPTIFVGGYDAAHGKRYGELVTKAAYTEYKRQRGPTGHGGMQGVGPCQLTYYAFQDEADRLGGCHLPLQNMLVGFGDMATLVRKYGLHAGVAAYNGAGLAAQRYAASVLGRLEGYRQVLAR